MARSPVSALVNQFPAVLILGACQCGKTTTAKYFFDGDYFDLENPSDHQVFMHIGLCYKGDPVILQFGHGNTPERVTELERIASLAKSGLGPQRKETV
jgi:hypothetical protein